MNSLTTSEVQYRLAHLIDLRISKDAPDRKAACRQLARAYRGRTVEGMPQELCDSKPLCELARAVHYAESY